MKRSEINKAIVNAKKMMEEYLWVLPQWGYWSKAEYLEQPITSKYLKEHQMGWDVTDFGKGLFKQQGITLFCIRNGIQGNTQDKPYAEKLLFMQEGQEIPYHIRDRAAARPVASSCSASACRSRSIDSQTSFPGTGGT